MDARRISNHQVKFRQRIDLIEVKLNDYGFRRKSVGWQNCVAFIYTACGPWKALWLEYLLVISVVRSHGLVRFKITAAVTEFN